MNLKSLILSKELKNSLFVIFLLTLIFGFNDKQNIFVLNSWLRNLLLVFALVGITVLVHLFSAKISANFLGQEAELKVLSAKVPKFISKKSVSFPLASIFGFLLTLISLGNLYFTAIFTIAVKKIPRLGKGFELYEKKESLIYFWALMGNLILIIIFNLIHFKMGVLINTWFLIWNLLPIPGLVGSRLFFNNKELYIFFVVLFVLIVFFIGKINLILLLILSIIIAFFVMLFWFFKIQYK